MKSFLELNCIFLCVSPPWGVINKIPFAQCVSSATMRLIKNNLPLPRLYQPHVLQPRGTTSLSRVNIMQLQAALLPWATGSSLARSHCSSPLYISTDWDILGPFQIGTREAEWGADPLESLGGFRNLTYDTTSRFKSSLPLNGTAHWSQTQLDFDDTTPDVAKGTVSVGFDNVDWDGLRSIYGWSGIQFQAWARGSLDVCIDADAASNQTTVVLHVWNIGEFWVDDTQYFGGDFYGYRRAPVVLQLEPGKHRLDVRVTHDIRNFGGRMPPKIAFGLEARVSPGSFVAVPEGVVVSDVVEGRIVGKWASIPLRNDAKNWVEVLGVVANNFTFAQHDLPLRFAPGQTRPTRFRVAQLETDAIELSLKFQYCVEGELNTQWVAVTIRLNKISHWYLPQKYTYIHPSGIVSYAVIRPPSPSAPCVPSKDRKLPILLVLHGAGVEVDSPQSKEQYDALPDLCSWLVLPSGVTSWSGDDWHLWGFADAEAAINSIPEWMKQVGWERQGIDLEKWVISGHSNGGQGTWYGLTHRNDKIIAAAPLSGYLSIPAYVPYHMWHEADPRKMAAILASLNTYNHELLVGNMVGTPIYQQHGQDDDNVPVFHSRRISQLMSEVAWETEYWEIPGKGHWWEGVMTDGGLPLFLKHYLQKTPVIQALPDRFSIVVANPPDMGARGGIVIDQLDTPDQLGRIDVELSNGIWSLKTSNIRRWHFGEPRAGLPSRVIIDDQTLNVSIAPNSRSSDWFVVSEEGNWSTVVSPGWKLHERNGRQLGALDAILNSKTRFNIILPQESIDSSYYKDVALDISRNLFQYFAADSEIVANPSGLTATDGNLIVLGSLDETDINVPDLGREFPIAKLGNTIVIADARGRRRTYPLEPGMGLVYLHPLSNERLALVIWGADEIGLRTAARLLPLRTGVGQPNFVVIGREMRWSGVGGVKAIGMFDSLWQVSHASYL